MAVGEGSTIYPQSMQESAGTVYWLVRSRAGKQLCVQGDASGFAGEWQGDVLVCPLSTGNAAALRERLSWLRPRPLGLLKSVGCGDRLGLATPGHVRAVRQFDLAPMFAQQSMRENARTGRSPQQVLDEAMWGVFEEGWRQPWGADADHLKSTADIELCAQAGYTLFTIDPGDHVDDGAQGADPADLQHRVRALPWDDLQDRQQDMERRYLGRSFALHRGQLTFDEPLLWRAAAKYGRAIAHSAHMYQHLLQVMAGQQFELEVSVDETEAPTSPLEHFFVASELRRLGVEWVSLAPRYVGRFEKGVDYIGNLALFGAEFARDMAVARLLGPYKLSLHSGSDKFSIYPLIARHAGDLVHLKTAGTSYLEALRTIAVVDPALFRDILGFARQCYEEDKASYHVSARLDRIPQPDEVPEAEMAALLSQFDTRQLLHVTFGSVLARYGQRIQVDLLEREEAHYAALEAHFVRHLEPFS